MTSTIPDASPPPHPPHVFIFQANLSGPLSESFQSFQRSPLLGSWVTTDPQGINNDRSLMWFAVIMQHADVAYHVQRAYMGADHLTFKGGGVVQVIWEKDIMRSDLEHKKVLQGNTCHTIALNVREKHFITRGFGGKKFLCKPMKSPIPWSKSNGRPLITCRKSCYCLILRLQHQSLIVHSRSKLVHVYSLLHDECNTAGRLGTF